MFYTQYVAKPRSKPPDKETSKDHLLRTGIALFASRGLEGTTVRDIAVEAGASLCLVSYHFGGKEGLYRACLAEYGRSRLEQTKGLLESVSSAEEFRVRLKLLLQGIVSSYTEFPELHKILGRELEAGLPLAKDVFEETFLKLMESLLTFFKSAQKKGIIRSDLDTSVMVTLIHGTISQWVRFDTVNKKYFDYSIFDPKKQEKYLESLLSVLLEGTLARRSQ